jgi:hypothetical protein
MLNIRTAKFKNSGDRAQPTRLPLRRLHFHPLAGLRFSDRELTSGYVRAPPIGSTIPNDWCPFTRGTLQHFPVPSLLYTTLCIRPQRQAR